MASDAVVDADAPEARIEYMALGLLQRSSAARNPKKHDVPGVAMSMQRYGFVAPPVLDDRTGKLVAGHGRIASLVYLRAEGKAPPVRIRVDSAGEWLVPVLRGVAFDSEDAAEEYLIADNRWVELPGWEPELADILEEVRARGEAALASIGFTSADVDKTIRALREPSTVAEPPTPDPPSNPTTQPGDLWILGEHRLVCGDCKLVARTALGGRLAHVVFTDPPYGVDYEGGTTKRRRLAGDDTTDLYETACVLAAEHTDEKAALYLCHAWKKSVAAGLALAQAGYEIRAQIIWNKNQAQYGALSAQYKQKHEPIFYAHRRGKAPRWYGPTNEITVWDIDQSSVNEFHPTQKPVPLVARALDNSSTRGEIVVDFFGGSGSAIMAGAQMGRIVCSTELDPAYCDVIVERWQQLTGESATRERGAVAEPVSTR